MADQDHQSGLGDRRPLVVGVVLVATGAMVAAVGALLSTVAAVSGARQWVQQLDQPPREMAKVKWHQARAAGLASAEAWRKASVA